MPTVLRYPYPRNVEEPIRYDTIRVHGEWASRKTKDDKKCSTEPESVSCLKIIMLHMQKNFLIYSVTYNAQKMKFSIKDFFSKCDQICRKLRISPYLLKKSLMENFIFCAVLG